MIQLAQPIAQLVNQLSKLPGIGPKSAQRLAYHILGLPRQQADELAHAISNARERIQQCERCFNFSEGPLCPVCADERRQNGIICVVQGPRDVLSLEKTREFKGRYHVLCGAISPMDGIGPDDIRIKELLPRLEAENVQEVILATSLDVEGEATALYIARLIKPLGVRVTRIAHGIPVGADLEYADETTLAKAIEGRREL